MPGAKVSILKREDCMYPFLWILSLENEIPANIAVKQSKKCDCGGGKSAVQTPGASRITVQVVGLVIEFPLPDGWFDLEFLFLALRTDCS